MNWTLRLKKLLPTSLFARLILIFFTGLLIILALSMLLNYEERDRLLMRASGNETAYRIADTVLLLDSLDVAERERIISVINVPPQRVALRWQPVAFGEQNPTTPETTTFLHTLQYAIGTERAIQVRLNTSERRRELNAEWERIEENNHMGGMGRGHMDGMGRGHMGGMGRGRRTQEQQAQQMQRERPSQDYYEKNPISYFVQVELQGGQWVTFDAYLFRDDQAPPPRMILTLIFILLAILLLLYLAVHWVTRPLKLLASAADALGRDINSPPISEKGPVEIKRAAHAFNTMQQRLKNFIQDRTHIFAAMSHDLKTPITRLRLRAELLDDDKLRGQFEKDLKEMEAMVTESLSFMRGLDTTEQAQPINIMAMFESLQEDYQDTGKTLTLQGQATAPLMGVAPLLKRCFVNLIDNAIFYGKQAHITLEDRPAALIIYIKDDGPGIPENEQVKVFDPFYRLEQSRNRQTGGTGLGLSIVRNIVQAHGGEITLKNAEQGGLEVILSFPRGIVLKV